MFDPCADRSCVEPMSRNLTVGTDNIEMLNGADYDIQRMGLRPVVALLLGANRTHSAPMHLKSAVFVRRTVIRPFRRPKLNELDSVNG